MNHERKAKFKKIYEIRRRNEILGEYIQPGKPFKETKSFFICVQGNPMHNLQKTELTGHFEERQGQNSQLTLPFLANKSYRT